ncbi:MAG: L,D-transpeptidase family protein [Rhodoplanes sp.]
MPRHSFALAFAVCAITVAPAAQAAVLVTIDKSIQQMTVEVDGRPLYQWPVSTGKGARYDTPNGKFKAFRMERDHFSKEWDDAPMPFSIFFTQKGHAIHGSYDVKRLGAPASHGCVRLAPANAKKLFALVEQEGVLNTTVVLTGVAPSGAPAVARRRLPSSDDLEEDYQPQQPQFGPRYGSNQPAYGNPYYVQPQYAQPQYRQPFGQPYALPRPRYLYRDPYTGQVYQQQQRPRTLIPFE